MDLMKELLINQFPSLQKGKAIPLFAYADKPQSTPFLIAMEVTKMYNFDHINN